MYVDSTDSKDAVEKDSVERDNFHSVERDKGSFGSLKEQMTKLLLDYPAGIQIHELPILFKVSISMFVHVLLVQGKD